MRIIFLTIAATLLALGLSLSSIAGRIADADSDLVPDFYDNCRVVANGPGQLTNQIDTDGDGFGNRCDCDFDQNNDTNGLDIVDLFTNFLMLPVSPLYDPDGNGDTNGLDVVICFGMFLSPPGPGSTGT